jgi:heme A synthase
VKGYGSWFYSSLLLSLFVISLTGLLLIPTLLDMRFEQDLLWRLSSPDRQITVALHTLFSYLILIMIGALYPIHIRSGIKTKRNNRTGISLVSLFALLLLSGIGLFYLGSENWILAASATHTIAGLSVTVMFTLHFLIRKRLKSV